MDAPPRGAWQPLGKTRENMYMVGAGLCPTTLAHNRNSPSTLVRLESEIGQDHIPSSSSGAGSSSLQVPLSLWPRSLPLHPGLTPSCSPVQQHPHMRTLVLGLGPPDNPR